MSEITQALFVAWQQPQTRRFFPVARLARIVEGACERCFEFAYVHGAADALAAGFQPFLPFPELHELYRSRELFPTFANRLMSESRMEYPLYLDRLGLGPEKADPMDVLGRSGGSRATDAVELFPLPSLDPVTGSYTTYFLAHGVRHLAPEVHQRIFRLQSTEPLFLMFDCQNDFDPSAIALRTADRIIVGYMPAYLLPDAFALLHNCGAEFFRIAVEKVNLHPAPMQQWLLCRLEACWPDEFVPFSEERYRPINTDAVQVRAVAQPA